MTSRVITGLVVTAVLLAACGSTVRQGGEMTAEGDPSGEATTPGLFSPDGSGTSVMGADSRPQGAATMPRPVGSGATPSGIPANNAATTLPAGTVSPAGGSPAPQAGGDAPGSDGSVQAISPPGLTDTEIHIGMGVLEGRDAQYEAAGVNASSGDGRERLRILTEDVNARGGMAGRQLVPVIHVYDSTSTQTAAEQEQAACATYTQDNQVFAALTGANASPILQCLTDAGVAILGTGPTSDLDDTDYARYPTLVATNAPSFHNVALLLSESLWQQGYFEPESLTGDVTIGLLRYDLPSHQRVTEEVLKPTLASHGLEVAVEIAVQAAQTNADYAAMLAAFQNAVLQFSAAGVDHVILFDRNGMELLFFTRFAENQNYRPQYGLTSLSTPHNAWATGALSQEQVATAVGAGWYPGGDSAPQFRPPNANSDRCFALMEANGQVPADDVAATFMLLDCDMFWLAEAALNAAPEPLNLQNYLTGVESLGDTYLPAGGLPARYGPGRHDGAGDWAPITFDSDCPCFAFGQPRPY